MKSFKNHISGQSGLSFREVINELTDVELEEKVQDYIQQQYVKNQMKMFVDFLQWTADKKYIPLSELGITKIPEYYLKSID